MSSANNLPVRIILRLNEGSDGILALRAARSLLSSDHHDCVYAYTDGSHIWAKRNRASVTAYELGRDSDASLAEDPKGLSREAVAARAEGIAQTPPETSHD